MDRQDVLRWLEEHPESVRGDPAEIVGRCERAVRRHAREDAWLAARDYVEDRAHEWEEQWSPPASEDFVAREVCPQLAYELRRHEPHVEEADGEHLAGGPVVSSLSPAAWRVVREWVLALAEREEHAAWEGIVRFTGKRAADLIRERHLTRETDWDRDHRYKVIAAHVAEMLAHDYSMQAHPR
jgi:hypothetical protein